LRWSPGPRGALDIGQRVSVAAGPGRVVVAGNQGATAPGVDGVTAVYVREVAGVPGFLDDLRVALKDGSFRPLPVRERMIPKPGGPGPPRL
jgi:retron-type reverse transcriptase